MLKLPTLSTIAARLRWARNQRGITQQALADLTDGEVSQQNIAKIEKEDLSRRKRKKRTSFILPLAKALNVNAEWLETGEGDWEPYIQYDDRFLSESNVESMPPRIADAASSVLQIPVIDWVLAKEGINAWETIKKDNRKMEFVYFAAEKRLANSLLALSVKGDSMISPSLFEKSYLPGEKIIYDPEAEPIDGKFVIAALPNEEEVIFRQYVVGGGIGHLKPLNPAYKMIQMTSEIKIVGVVVGYAGNVP